MSSHGPQPIKILSPEERQQRNRDEMIGAILQTAREIMREEGVGALNLNEVARRLGITTPALYSYFANKMAIYEALCQLAGRVFLEGDEAAWSGRRSGWECIAAWMEIRIDLSLRYPELYHLIYGAPMPGYTRSEEILEMTRRVLETIRGGVREMVESGEMDPGVPIGRAVDLLLAMRHGIVAERLSKASYVPPGSGRLEHLVSDALAMLKTAWAVRPETGTGGDSASD